MHPGLDNVKWSELTDEDITNRVTELQKRVGMARHHGGHVALNQLILLLETYTLVQQDRLRILQEEMMKENIPNYGKKSIDIDWDYGKDRIKNDRDY